MITHVINLVAHKNLEIISGLKYLNLSLKDTPECNILSVLPKVTEFVQEGEETEDSPRF